MKKLLTLIFCTSLVISALAAPKQYALSSPDGKLVVKVNTGDKITYAVSADGTCVLAPSEISLQLENGFEYGGSAKAASVTRKSVNDVINTVIYKKAQVVENYNEMTLNFKDFQLVFRAFNDGIWPTGSFHAARRISS